MNRERKVELIQRSLALRHKLKVHGSMATPDTHEDLAVMLISKWELEDELNAVEQLLAGARDANVQDKKKLILEAIRTDTGSIKAASMRKQKPSPRSKSKTQ